MRIFHLAAPAKQRVSFIKKQNRTCLLGTREDCVQIPLSLADVFADHLPQVHAVNVARSEVAWHPQQLSFSNSKPSSPLPTRC